MASSTRFSSQLVQTTTELQSFVDYVKDAAVLTLDTEFMREKTYYPKLCLVQIAAKDRAVAIDTLADNIDLSPLWFLLNETTGVKVLHAARQDMEIFWYHCHKLPTPMFDTQIAGMVLGLGDQVGYETIVNSLTGHKLDKSSRFTDWSHRPLSLEQFRYAIDDVTHLMDVYEITLARLEDTGRTEWIKDEMARHVLPDAVITKPEDAWRRLKIRNDKPAVVAACIQLAAWREREAQQKNVPRGYIVKDDVILALANQRPADKNELGNTRGISSAQSRRYGDAVLNALQKAHEMPTDDIPRPPRRKHPSGKIREQLEVLRVLLRICSEKQAVASSLITTTDEMEKWLNGTLSAPSFMSGWRHDIFGRHAQDLVKGILWLGIKDGKTMFESKTGAV